MGLKIGQRVVCVEQHPQNIVVVGEIYTIKDVINCPTCNIELVDVGVTVPANGIFCTGCGNGVKTNGKWFLFAHRFRPLDDLEEQLHRIETEGNQVEEELSIKHC